MAAGPLLYGTLVICTPTMLASISVDTSCEVLALAKVTSPGFCFASAMSSRRFFAGTSLLMATISGTCPM